jgi:hypothetical protein
VEHKKRVSFSDRLITHMELPSNLTSLQVKFDCLFLNQSSTLIASLFSFLLSEYSFSMLKLGMATGLLWDGKAQLKSKAD